MKRPSNEASEQDNIYKSQTLIVINKREVKRQNKMASMKIIGYILAALGLAGIVFSNKLASLLSFLGSKALIYAMVGSVALVAVGVVFILSESRGGKVSQAEEEVPIYEGTGKKRKIVGYQKASK